jgi:hypothetical protein
MNCRVSNINKHRPTKFLKMVLNTKNPKTNQTIRPLIILRFVSVTSQGLDFQCHMLW